MTIENTCKAKIKEIDNWKKNNVYEEVENNGQSVISVRWVITDKIKDGNTVTKARLVARGFEEDMQDNRTDSPTCSKDSFRIAMSLIAMHGWHCHSIGYKGCISSR